MGSRKGIPNKRTTEFLAVLEENNFCPATAMIECYEEARKIYQGYSVVYDAIQQAKSDAAGYDIPLEDKAHVYLKIAADMAKDLACYAYPRRKAIDVVHTQPLAEKAEQARELLKLTDQELLEAMKERLKELIEPPINSNE